MPTVLDFLRNEDTIKLIQGAIRFAGTFIMQQVGGEDDKEQQKLLNQYYKNASAVVQKYKGKQQMMAESVEEEHPEVIQPSENREVSVRKTKTEACAACTRNHVAAAAGLLAEGKRFLDAGLTSPEVVDRINLATQELTTAERGDLNPAKIQRLPPDEKELATWMAQRVRDMRHVMDHIKSKEDYQNAISELSELSREITKRYYTMMENISPEKELEAIKRICKEKPESEREKCLETMTQVLKQ